MLQFIKYLLSIIDKELKELGRAAGTAMRQ